jgi:hypothetical protein
MSPELEERHEHDDAASLQQLGYRQEMSRVFSSLSGAMKLWFADYY